ncbi:carboxypeptidase-like regulatory domain-containing protein [Chishuiella sp.]|uniref:carboxypeptidase-like regulatory domain-containing protein n=1 Tax=Chishuiella sp. TaxID=1969467 RepID=UPI0028A5D2A2|nr:carboxypeptidase-like regulatory domain-containing protein [Chishuiella sp.]
MAVTFNYFSEDGTNEAGLQYIIRISTPNGQVASSIKGTLSIAVSDESFRSYSSPKDLTYIEYSDVKSWNNTLVSFNKPYIPWKDIWNKFFVVRIQLIIDGVESIHYTRDNLDFNKLDGSTKKSRLDNNSFDLKGDNVKMYLSQLNTNSLGLYTGLVSTIKLFSKINFESVGTKTIYSEAKNILVDTEIPVGTRSLMILSEGSIIELKDKTIESEPITYSIDRSDVWSFTPLKDVKFLDNKLLDIAGIHGSILYNGRYYGSARFKLTNYNLVSINVKDSSDIKYYNIADSSGNVISNLEQILRVGKYLYMAGLREYIRFDTETEEIVVKKPGHPILNASQVPILVDNEYLYAAVIDKHIYKYKLTDFDNNSISLTVYQSLDIDISNYVVSGTEVHSSAVDNENLYLAYTTAQDGQSCAIVKIDKVNLLLTGVNKIARSTDDMTSDDSYLYLGAEQNIKGYYGSNYGAIGVRKSDLNVYNSSLLDELDADTFQSYASLFFGKTLIDSKTNGRIYVLNTDSVESWKIDEAPIGVTSRYKYLYQSYEGELQGIINELEYNYEDKIFYGFVWRNNGTTNSRYVSFELPDLVLVNKPIISYAIFEVINQNTKFKISATLISSGGVAVLDCGFIIREDGLESKIKLSNSLGIKEYILDTKAKKVSFCFYAENSEGVEYSTFLDLPIVYNYDYIIQGKVYYNSNTIIPNAKVILIDTNDNTLFYTTTSDQLGQYEFRNLVENRIYLLSAYFNDYRSLSKLVTPSISQ